MKKILALILVLAMCFSLVACGGGEDAKDPAANNGGSNEAEGGEASAEPKKVLYYTAFIGDFGLADMGWRAAQAAKEKYGYDVTLVEYGQDSSQAVNSLVDAMDTKDYDIVMSMGWYIADTVIEKSVSGEWADTTFILYDTSLDFDVQGCDNIYGISFGQNEGCFLVAIYSALMTKTGKIGCVINLDMPVTNDFGAGWLHGYKYARTELGMSDLGMMYTYMGEVTVQGDYESVNVVMDNGCDYVLNVGGAVALGAMQAAEEKGGVEGGKFIIGTDYDQYTYFESVGDVVGYKTMVTSMLKNIEAAVALLLESVEGDGSIAPGNGFYGVAAGATGLCENDWYKENTPQEVQDKIHEIADKITSGEIDVVSYFDFPTYEAFAEYRDNIDATFEEVVG